MEQLSLAKDFNLQDHFKKLRRRVKAKKKKLTFVQTIIKKRGLTPKIRDLVVFSVIDKMLSYDYKYEHSYFQEAEDFKTVKGYIKYISKTVDTKFNFVSNDIEANHFNGFKTFVTFNTKIYKFIKSYEKMRPLKKINLYTKRIEGLFPKQKEFYNLTGGNRNYHTLEVLTDVTDKTSTFSNIFAYFTLLKKHVISLLTQVNDLSFTTLFKTIFITRLAYFRNKIVILLNGLKAIIRRSKFRFRLRRKFNSKQFFKSDFKPFKAKSKHFKRKYLKPKRFFFIKKMKLQFHKNLINKKRLKAFKILHKEVNFKSNRYLLTRIKPKTYKLFLKNSLKRINKIYSKRLRLPNIKMILKPHKRTFAIRSKMGPLKLRRRFFRKKLLIKAKAIQYHALIYKKCHL